MWTSSYPAVPEESTWHSYLSGLPGQDDAKGGCFNFQLGKVETAHKFLDAITMSDAGILLVCLGAHDPKHGTERCHCHRWQSLK
jgi:hypothetical protein